MENLSHLNKHGNARMVNTSSKQPTARYARARGSITMKKQTLDLVEKGEGAKGDVLSVARVAGIMGAKSTSRLIPLCHPLHISSVEINFKPDSSSCSIVVLCEVQGVDRSGFEMEALTGVSTALLTIYDMTKSADKSMKLGDIYLEEKTGGKSGHYRADNNRMQSF